MSEKAFEAWWDAGGFVVDPAVDYTEYDRARAAWDASAARFAPLVEAAREVLTTIEGEEYWPWPQGTRALRAALTALEGK